MARADLNKSEILVVTNTTTMAEMSISIENKYFGDEHKVITMKQQFLGIILWLFVYSK